MKFIRAVALCIVVLSLFSCTLPVPPPPPVPPTPTNPDQVNLNKNMELWRHSNFSSYAYTYKRLCFCPSEEDILVTVTDGQVTAASYSPSGITLSPERVNQLMTVEGFFQVIQKAISAQVARLEVNYNVTSGYPETIYIDIDEQMADEAMTYIVSELH